MRLGQILIVNICLWIIVATKNYEPLSAVWMVMMAKGGTNRHINNFNDKIQHIKDDGFKQIK